MEHRKPKPRKFFSLSVKDLLEAREAYHVHLAHLDNVFATAIGRYLIRNDDPNEGRKTDGPPPNTPRTLANSAIKDWSWPCVLVFVDQWRTRDEFGDAPDAMVPRLLYMPDGRVVPTCVVAVERDDNAPEPAEPPLFPSDLCGGGYPVLTDVQGRQHLGSIACMVTDGDAVYALTNRHVLGEAGREVYSIIKGARQRLGVSDGNHVGKLPFAQVYQGWPGKNVLANLDAGLLRVDNVNRWTAQVYGVGELGPVRDLNTETFDLDLVSTPVKAFGAAAGPMQGQIMGLFYRYKSMGGFDYVSDFVIGPRAGGAPLNNLPGNSGTLWMEDSAAEPQEALAVQPSKPRPFAVQWGGQVLTSPGSQEVAGTTQFALATCLATICRELDVEVVTNWNVGHTEYWGAVGHFKIGALACELVTDREFGPMALANQANVAYDDETLIQGPPTHKKGEFVPLADVADLVWRMSRPQDGNNHFADMDRPGAGQFKGKTLLDLAADPGTITPDVWNDFYASIGDDKRGALPFRIWQMYDEAVDHLAAGKYQEFFCALGLMAHYWGDACQPLHVSQFHHGLDPADKPAARVHSVYETTMLAENARELVTMLAKRVRKLPPIQPRAGNGRMAAQMVVDLMQRTVKALPPLEVVKAFNDMGNTHSTAKLWTAVGDRTADRIADGARSLAEVWQCAWMTGRAAQRTPSVPPAGAFDQGKLMKLYSRQDFCPSSTLDHLTVRNDRIVPS